MNEIPPQEEHGTTGAPRRASPPPEETRQGDATRPEPGRQGASGPPPAHTRAQQPRQGSRPPQQTGTRRQYSRQRASATPPPVQPAPPPGPARQRVQQRRQPVPPSQSGLYFPWWSLVLMVGIVGVIAFSLLYFFTEISEPAAPGDQVPRIQVVTSQPTLSQDFTSSSGQAAAPPGGAWPTAIPQAQPSATVPLPTPVPTQTLPPGDFAIGVTIQVVGVGEAGLNVRSAPGLDGTPLFLAGEGDFYTLVGGPQDVDGYEWWKIEDPDNPASVGWAARNFLMVASQ